MDDVHSGLSDLSVGLKAEKLHAGKCTPYRLMVT